ncbi:MAG: alpha/beta fold hydrolase [Betaproteobacteria bacterium]|nr:alpha/beta fold hydrolase [Betaproteobacteria bacterium]
MVPVALFLWLACEGMLYAWGARALFDASLVGAALAALAGVLAVRAVITAVTWSFARAYPSPAPELRMSERLRMVVGEYLAFLLTFVAVLPFERLWMPPDRLRPASTPLVLVHGYGCSRGVWWRLRRQLEAAGHVVATVSLTPPYTHIGMLVPQLRQRIDEVCRATGAPQVILVAHSMGGLVCRSYLSVNGPQHVARLVTLASPHMGTQLARIGIGANAREMEPGSRWLADLAAEPLHVPAVSLRTAHDNYVMPQDNQRLPGARDVELAGIGHLAVLYADRTGSALLAALA